MLSTIEKIFKDKTIRSFELNYKEDIPRNTKIENSKITKKNTLLEKLISDGSKVLDIGCGDGRLLSNLLKQKQDIEVLGIDISEMAVGIANKHGVKAECLDITKMVFPDDWIFDYIIMADFIEHIPDPENLLIKLKAHFKRTIIISIPNIGYITARLRLFIGGRFPLQWARHPGEHLRFWTVKDFYCWAEQLGYKVERVIPIRGSFLKNIFPSLFSAKNIFVLVKK